MSIYILCMSSYVTSYGIPFLIGQLVTLPAHWLFIPAVILLIYCSIVLERRHLENPAIDFIIDELLILLNM